MMTTLVSMRRRSAVAAMFFMTAGLALPGTSSRFGQAQDRFGINWMILHERPMPSA
jgi:uncharacterized glyoxalase superfamily protein PhnB